MEIFIIWLGGSIFSGMIASNKNRSFFGYFMLGALLSPLIGIGAALIVKDNSEPIIQKVEVQNTSSSNDTKTSEGANKLKELNSLKDQGLITDEEFEEKRKKIVNDMF